MPIHGIRCLLPKAVDKTVEDMNEWVDELHADINDVKMAAKPSGREAEAANDKLDKITYAASTRLVLLKDINIRLSETTVMILDECHQREALERMRTIHLEIIERGKWVGVVFLGSDSFLLFYLFVSS